MNVIVGVTDRSGFAANTDNLVLVRPSRRELLWIPRDLWCPAFGDRINRAFGEGGHHSLVAALAEHGLEAAGSVVLSRDATESALAAVRVLVPIPVPMTFAYPLAPTAPIEDGSRQITFRPPAEVLRGERIHQWIGARGGSDLHRIERQKILLRRLIEDRVDFRACLARPEWVRVSEPAALDTLAVIDATWRFETFGPTVPETIKGRQVLVHRA